MRTYVTVTFRGIGYKKQTVKQQQTNVLWLNQGYSLIEKHNIQNTLSGLEKNLC